MPWKETDVVDQRVEFALRALRGDVPFTQLCEDFGISTKTGYKWRERFFSQGLAGMENQSRRPLQFRELTSEETVCELVRLKMAHRTWGPKKICELYKRLHGGQEACSLSTVKRILDRAGLVEHRKRKRSRECGRLEHRIQAQAPNDLWTVDFKGWWYSRDRKRVEPLTVRDSFSRYILCAEIVPDSRSETVRRSLEKIFQRYGLPGTIRSDNGSPFASTNAPLGLSRLSAWWLSLGIHLDRIEPGRPDQNGGHERMHRDIALEVENENALNADAQQAILDVWRNEFNTERPHEALEMKVPADVYRKSEREFSGRPEELEYPVGYLRRRVGKRGWMKIDNHAIWISTALGGWDVGLKPVGGECYIAYFGEMCLGEVDARRESFRAVKAADPSASGSRIPGTAPSILSPSASEGVVTDADGERIPGASESE